MNFTRVPDQPHLLLGRCLWCNRSLVIDEQRDIFSHEAPVCAGFEGLTQRMRDEHGAGAAREIGPELLPAFDDDGRPPS